MASLFRVQPNAANVFTDSLARHTCTNVGGTVITEGTTKFLRLGNAAGNQIRVADNASNFVGGFSLETEVMFETDFSGEYFMFKAGSFMISILNSKLWVQALTFPNEVIEGVSAPKFNYFPVDVDSYPGRTPIELNVWTRILITYHQVTGELIIRLNGKEDIRIHRYRGGELLQDNNANSFRFLEGFKNVKVKYIHVSNGAPRIKTPMRGQCYYRSGTDDFRLFFDKIDNSVQLPFEITVTRELIGYNDAVVLTKISRNNRSNFNINVPAGDFGIKTLNFRAEISNDKTHVTSFSFVKARRLNTSNYKLDAHGRLLKNNVPIFPIAVYHALPSDFALLKSYGANLIYNGLNVRSRFSGVHPDLQITLTQCLTEALAQDIGLVSEADGHSPNLSNLVTCKDSPACAGMYLVDEPTTGYSDLLQTSAAITKIADPKGFLSFMAIHKNERVGISAQHADILAFSVYPIPNISLRMVGDAIKRAVEATGGNIPIWYIIPTYIFGSEVKIPTLLQFIAMAMIARCARAKAFMLYTWDDRQPVEATNAVSGYYTKDYPAHQAIVQQGLGFLNSMKEVLVCLEATVQPTLLVASPSIWFVVLQDAGARYLIVVNDAEVTKSFTLSFADLFTASVTCLYDGGANTAIPGTSGTLPITLTGHQACIYSLPLIP